MHAHVVVKLEYIMGATWKHECTGNMLVAGIAKRQGA